MTILFYVLTLAVIWIIGIGYYLLHGNTKPTKMIVISTPDYETGMVTERTINPLTKQVFKSITYPIKRSKKNLFSLFESEIKMLNPFQYFRNSES